MVISPIELNRGLAFSGLGNVKISFFRSLHELGAPGVSRMTDMSAIQEPTIIIIIIWF